jgi:hypothetical protein
MANPRSDFYWNDWVVDPAVRSCSMAARGFWMELLAIAAAAGGYVRINGKPCSTCKLAALTGQDKRSVSKWVRELERNGVFSRTEDGTIFCRRMVREAAKRRQSRKKGVPDKRVSQAPDRSPNTVDSLEEPTPNPQKKPPFLTTRSSFAASLQDSTSTSKPLSPSSTPRARESGEGEEVSTQKENPEEGRSAPLLSHGPPCRVAKSSALKAKIREQLQQKHARYLIARRRPDELTAYWTAMLDPDPVVAQRAFDAVDHRMRCARWDDMRAWKRQHGVAM